MISLENFLPYYLVAATVLLVANVVWAYRDARQRGRSGVLIALLVLFVPFPVGVVLWILFRPALPADPEPEETGPESPLESDEHREADADIKRRANAGLL